MMQISYQHFSEFPGWTKMPEFIKNFIQKNKIRNIFEVGAGANPTISVEYVKELNLNYNISDVDEDELNKADDAYHKIKVDLSKRNLRINKSFDLIFSRMVGEHISDGKMFHQNVHKLLIPGGFSIHCFSTLYAFPFILNKIIPENISGSLLKIFAQRDEHKHGKFKAHYSWSRGPTRKILKQYSEIGYDLISYTGYFGHAYYHKIKPLNFLEELKASWLLKNPLPSLTSYACIILKKGLNQQKTSSLLD